VVVVEEQEEDMKIKSSRRRNPILIMFRRSKLGQPTPKKLLYLHCKLKFSSSMYIYGGPSSLSAALQQFQMSNGAMDCSF
jgi:hypothetical protein